MNVRRSAARAGLAAAVAMLVGGAVSPSALAEPSCTIAEQTAYAVVVYVDTHQPRAGNISSVYEFDPLTDPGSGAGPIHLEGQFRRYRRLRLVQADCFRGGDVQPDAPRPVKHYVIVCRMSCTASYAVCRASKPV